MIQPSEIWLVDLTDSKGHEQRGKRPGLIVGKANGLFVTIPLTTTMPIARFSYTHIIACTPQNGLDHDSVAMVFQIVALDNIRFLHKIGSLDQIQMEIVRGLLKDLLKIQ